MTSGLAILAIGFFLGMRHATDPDHVIAVSAIVSRERSIAKAAFIGVLWGLGHTLTILAVGTAIILFGLAIPTRVGLAHYGVLRRLNANPAGRTESNRRDEMGK